MVLLWPQLGIETWLLIVLFLCCPCNFSKKKKKKSRPTRSLMSAGMSWAWSSIREWFGNYWPASGFLFNQHFIISTLKNITNFSPMLCNIYFHRSTAPCQTLKCFNAFKIMSFTLYEGPKCGNTHLIFPIQKVHVFTQCALVEWNALWHDTSAITVVFP